MELDLTKRELFAAIAMHAMIEKYNLSRPTDKELEEIANNAFKIANFMILKSKQK